MIQARGVGPVGQVSKKFLALLLLALLSALGAGWYQSRPEPPIELVACDDPESVRIMIDDSPSAQQYDPGDLRTSAAVEIIRLVAAEPCTPNDTMTVVSFTEVVEVTGPASAGALGRINRAVGESTDIAGAVAVVQNLAQDTPGHREVVLMITDLEDNSSIPIDTTLNEVSGVIVISIGDIDAGGDVTQFDLRYDDEIARRIADAINESREQS